MIPNVCTSVCIFVMIPKDSLFGVSDCSVVLSECISTRGEKSDELELERGRG